MRGLLSVLQVRKPETSLYFRDKVIYQVSHITQVAKPGDHLPLQRLLRATIYP